MNYIDIIIAVILLFAAIKGYVRGFIVEVFSLLAFVLGLFLAIEFATPLTQRFFQDSDYFTLMSILIFLAIFISLAVVINLLAKWLKKIVDLTILGVVDNIFGTLISMLKMALILSVIFWFFDSIGIDLPEEQASTSMILPYIVPIGPKAFEVLNSIIPYFHNLFESIGKFDDSNEMV